MHVIALGCGPGPEIAAAEHHFPVLTALGIDSFNWSHAVRSFTSRDFGFNKEIRFQQRAVNKGFVVELQSHIYPRLPCRYTSPLALAPFFLVIAQCLLFDLSKATEPYTTFFEDYASLFNKFPSMMLLVIENGGSERCNFLHRGARTLERKVQSAKCELIQPGHGCMIDNIELQNVLFLLPRTALQRPISLSDLISASR